MLIAMLLLNILRCFFWGVNPDAQAEILLSYASPSEQTHLWREGEAFGEAGNLWLVGQWNDWQAGVSLINPRGKVLIDRLPLIPDLRGYRFIFNQITFDRWGNAIIRIQRSDPRSDKSSIHLVRVTPEGQVSDYSSWLSGYCTLTPPGINMLPGDTLFLVGSDKEQDIRQPYRYRFTKVIMDAEGYRLIDEGVIEVDRESLYKGIISLSAAAGADGRAVLDRSKTIILNWENDAGIKIRLGSSDKFLAPETLYVERLNLKQEKNYLTESIGAYIWRDYVWRTYKDIWISLMRLVPGEKGGYTLYIPEPDTNYLHKGVYVVRLDEEYKPVDPAALDGGGNYTPMSFERLPESAEPRASFGWWYSRDGSVRDSAYVNFWGCDDEGNVYSYFKTRKFGEE